MEKSILDALKLTESMSSITTRMWLALDRIPNGDAKENLRSRLKSMSIEECKTATIQ